MHDHDPFGVKQSYRLLSTLLSFHSIVSGNESFHKSDIMYDPLEKLYKSLHPRGPIYESLHRDILRGSLIQDEDKWHI